MSSKLVLVLNCGSSSLKFAIIDAVNGEEYLSGLAECFHLPEARIKWKMDGNKQEAALGAGAAHSEALNFIVNTILAQKPELSAQLTAIGHRIVHGGEKYTSSVVIDESVIQGIKDAASFAPLHNPAHLIGIEEALKSFPQLKDKNVAVFDTESTIPADRFAYALNPLLPEDIVVVASDEVEADWHPRHCDTEKTYEYKILNSKFPDPMRRRDTYHVSFDLNLEKMREAAGYLKGEHDFKSFCNVHTQVEDTVRTIYDLEVEKEEELITIRVRGNGFLYNMVRILAGTLIGVGRGAIAPEQIPAILEAKDRQAAGMTVPPQGLRLVKIDYLDEKSK